MKKNSSVNPFFKAVIVAFGIAIALEVFVFNFRFYVPLDDKITEFDVEAVNGLQEAGDRFIFVNNGNEKDIETHTFYINNIDAEVDNLYIKLNTDEMKNCISIFAADEANALPFHMGQRWYLDEMEESHYITLHLSGKVSQIRIDITGVEGTGFYKDDIALNVKRPFIFQKTRVLVLWLFFIMLICVYRKTDIPYVSRMRYKYVIIGGSLVLNIAMVYCFAEINTYDMYPQMVSHTEYEDLVKAFLDNRLWIFDDAPQWLLEMDNPYDTELRNMIQESMKAEVVEGGKTYRWQYRWDTVFYDGKYYVYFGVVPALLFYMPYYLLTGANLFSYKVIEWTAILFIFAVYGLVGALIRKYFKDTSLIKYLLIVTGVVFGSGLLWQFQHPTIYAIPIVTGAAFLTLGLYLWIEASMHMNESRGRALLALGSLSVAFVAGCRPQMLMGAFASVFLFGRYFIDGVRKKDRDTFVSGIAFLLPVCIVAVLLMWYNYARFGSVTDFGVKYTLTTNDMTKRGFEMDRNGLAIFTFLFQLPAITAVFPFVKRVSYETAYMGKNIWETVFGGLIVSNTFLWILFFIRGIYKKASVKITQVYGIVIWFLLSVVVIAVADANMAGILQRYFMDMGVFAVIAAAVLWLAYNQKEGALHKLLFWAVTMTVIYNVLLMFADDPTLTDTPKPYIYYQLFYLIQFWL